MANSQRSAVVRMIANLWKAWTRCAQAVFGAWAWEAPRWYTWARGAVVDRHPGVAGAATRCAPSMFEASRTTVN